jgi:trehalose 6-phosphate synthase
MSHSALAGLYRMSRIGLVTPLRDGMNLVAKEYVAAQAPGNPGVLVLSQFAGAALELKSALIINPYDIEATAAAIARAFDMPLAERKDRWSDMIAGLRANSIHDWAAHFLGALGKHEDAEIDERLEQADIPRVPEIVRSGPRRPVRLWAASRPPPVAPRSDGRFPYALAHRGATAQERGAAKKKVLPELGLTSERVPLDPTIKRPL